MITADLFDPGMNPVCALSRLGQKSNVSGFVVQCERRVISFIAVPVPLQGVVFIYFIQFIYIFTTNWVLFIYSEFGF